MKKKERQVVEFDVAFDGSYDYQVKIVPGNPITVAEIHYTSKTDERDDGLLTYGLGVRKHGDKYDWERGCKSALVSCFRNHPATSDKLRKAIWCGFFEAMLREKTTNGMVLPTWDIMFCGKPLRCSISPEDGHFRFDEGAVPSIVGYTL